MVSALIILSDGAEDIEMTTCLDVLNRAGVEVTLAGLQRATEIKCANGLRVIPDTLLSDVSSKLFDVVVLPGGLKGSQEMAASSTVGTILKSHEANGKYIAAICAAPTVLQEHKIHTGKKFTCYKGFQSKMPDYRYCEESVVQDGNLITSRGPGTAFHFAMKLVEVLVSKEKSQALIDGMLVQLH